MQNINFKMLNRSPCPVEAGIYVGQTTKGLDSRHGSKNSIKTMGQN